MKHRIATGLFCAALLLLYLLGAGHADTWIWVIFTTVTYLLLTGYGAYNLSLNWYLTSVNRCDSEQVLLTFDDGPDPDFTPQILRILRSHQVKAVFFVIGQKAETYPDIVREIMDDGHLLGNHSYTHDYRIGFFSRPKLAEDLVRCNDVIRGISGSDPTYFRPPFGVTNPRFGSVLRRIGLKSMGWTIRSYDTLTKEPEALTDYVLRRLKPGSIILFHDNQKVTADALPGFLKRCIDKQFIFVQKWR